MDLLTIRRTWRYYTVYQWRWVEEVTTRILDAWGLTRLAVTFLVILNGPLLILSWPNYFLLPSGMSRCLLPFLMEETIGLESYQATLLRLPSREIIAMLTLWQPTTNYSNLSLTQMKRLRIMLCLIICTKRRTASLRSLMVMNALRSAIRSNLFSLFVIAKQRSTLSLIQLNSTYLK